MNIRSDYLEALRRQEEQRVSKTGRNATDAFGKMFTEEMSLAGSSEGSLPVPPPGAGRLDPLLLGTLDAMDGATPASVATPLDEQAVLQSLGEQTAGLLDNWEAYTQTLGSGSGRDAWNLLAGMGEPLRQLRGELNQLGPNKAGLDAVVNELEVLTATETFKFNRGDYGWS